MKRIIASIIVVFGLSPCLASAKNICIQLNTTGGDVLVLKGVGKGAKAVSAYIAQYNGGSSFTMRAMSGTALVGADGDLGAGLTEYGVGEGGGFIERTVFHRVRCNAGSDGKLGELDSCSDVYWIVPNNDQESHFGIIIPCIPEVAFP